MTTCHASHAECSDLIFTLHKEELSSFLMILSWILTTRNEQNVLQIKIAD